MKDIQAENLLLLLRSQNGNHKVSSAMASHVPDTDALPRPDATNRCYNTQRKRESCESVALPRVLICHRANGGQAH